MLHNAGVTPAQPKRAPAPAAHRARVRGELRARAAGRPGARQLPRQVPQRRATRASIRRRSRRRSCSAGRTRSANISASTSRRADRRSKLLAGNRVLPGMQPYAARYGGHQFGHWAGQLGDGRAITLGEVIATDGTRQELQLKGAGRTPYSRTADGRAVLRSSLREFLCSEAMHFLGVPTTRALSLVATGEPVIRDMFYDGHPAPEPGAVVCRVAPVLRALRQLPDPRRATARPSCSSELADYVIRAATIPGLDYAEFFQEVCRRTALLMVDWMRLGFVHGVMNTDNMSILGADHRLRPLRLARRLRPAVDAEHHRRAEAGATATATSRRSRSGTWRASPKRCCRWSRTRRRSSRASTLYAETFNAAWQQRARAEARRRRARPARRRRAGAGPLRAVVREPRPTSRSSSATSRRAARQRDDPRCSAARAGVLRRAAPRGLGGWLRRYACAREGRAASASSA